MNMLNSRQKECLKIFKTNLLDTDKLATNGHMMRRIADGVSLFSLETGYSFIYSNIVTPIAGADKIKQFNEGVDLICNRMKKDYTVFPMNKSIKIILDSDSIVGIFYIENGMSGCNIIADCFWREDKSSPAVYFENLMPYEAVGLKRLGVSPHSGTLVFNAETMEANYPTAKDSFYPFLSMTAREVWREFEKSKSNVLLLMGPPGTGKTTFIRTMMDERGWDDVILADQINVLENIELPGAIRKLDHGSVFIAEDADVLVEERTNNEIMTGLLNLTEGVVSNGIKLIISTNITNLKNIDSALIRPGRTFQILNFKELDFNQMLGIKEELGLPTADVKNNKQTWTLSEALNAPLDKVNLPDSTFGFYSNN